MEELLKKIDDLGNELQNINELYMMEVKEKTDNPKFDCYSSKGKKLLRKIALKYADLLLDKEDELQKLQDELNVINKETRSNSSHA